MATNGNPITVGDGIATALHYFAGIAIDAEHARNEMLYRYDAIAIPKDYDIHKLEGLALGRNRPRGTFTTDSVEDFARAANDAEHTVRTFIDAKQWRAEAVLNWGADGGRQGHCDYVARLNVQPSPEWLALGALHNSKFTQRALIDFIEDWTPAITGFTDLAGGTLTTPGALAAIRAIEMHATKNTYSNAAEMKTERGVLDAIEARDIDKWPAVMGWACTPALGLQPIVASVRLSVMTSRDEPTISARIIAFDALRDHVARAFALMLAGKLNDAPFGGKFDPGA